MTVSECEHEDGCRCFGHPERRKELPLLRKPRPKVILMPRDKVIIAGLATKRDWDSISNMVLARPGGEGHWKGSRFVLDRHGVCERCGQRRATDPHHRRLVSQGGPDECSNLAALCRTCHDWCHGHPTEARGGGWIVERGQDWRVKALQLHDGSLVLLDDEAGYSFVGWPQGHASA